MLFREISHICARVGLFFASDERSNGRNTRAENRIRLLHTTRTTTFTLTRADKNRITTDKTKHQGRSEGEVQASFLVLYRAF